MNGQNQQNQLKNTLNDEKISVRINDIKKASCIIIQVVSNRNKPLQKLMNAYCEKEGKEFSDLRFLYNGERLQPKITPEALEMEDGDCIDVMIEQYAWIDILFRLENSADINQTRGAFGEVLKAYWKNGEKVVALKTLLDNPSQGAEESFDNFVREVFIFNI
ncbi:35781_t:CDS:2 [Racocetra persica]|uniref:35781_t:CDS:1 n=1 Tax=Racocetra persica TaxID=160502 RepID=A0ACA9LDU0_9GLOM|nr:35781_t:CDS:2 [Racocetra persica]